MALVNETRTIRGNELSYTYSDEGKYILQTDTGRKYAEAYDPLDHTHTYEETDEDIPTVETPEKEEEATEE